MDRLPKFALPLLIVSLVANGYLLLGKLPDNKTTEVATVQRVVDGDTFITTSGDTIRLAAIDAPEFPDGCLSLASKEELESLISEKDVEIEEAGKDNFGRLVCFVYLDGVMINEFLVGKGLAYFSDDGAKYAPSLVKAETEAKTLKQGVWSTACTKEGNCNIKGNVRKDNNTKIYHLSDCFNYEKVVIDESNQDRWFCTEEEAVEAGFVRSQDCP